MQFSKFVCWDSRQVNQVIKPDAEGVEDHVFLAVHSDQRLLLSRTGSKDNLTSTDGREFLSEFMDPEKSEVFGMVLGESGAGKSHFIHWLRLNIQADASTRVVNIPKVGTSLKGILRSIIRELPEDAQSRYVDQLGVGGGGGSLTKSQKMGRFLDAIAQALEAKVVSGDVAEPKLLGILQELPHLFRDPQVREEHFLRERPNNVIEGLVAHVFEAGTEYVRIEQARSFKPNDLELPPGIMSKVSLRTRGVVDLLKLKRENIDKAVEAINLCLDDAICSALSFSSDHLIDLMGEVRAYLHSQGLSLILLIEDLSRLQGVDTALLQSLTTPRGQWGRSLSPIRWAAAMTTGYFDRLDQTVRSRLHILAQVEPDQKLNTLQEEQEFLARFVARYLNAVRLGEDNLRILTKQEALDSLPNACHDCRHQASCHEAFGVAEDFGLYPFTAQALLNMAQRVTTGSEHWFNPRRILKRIVIPILFQHNSDLKSGTFPQSHLLDDFGIGKLANIAVEDLRKKAGSNFSRHLVLQELWSQVDDSLVAFGKDLLRAFNLNELDVASSPVPPPPSSSTPPTTTGTGSGQSVDPVVEALRRWSKGEDLSDVTASSLRPLVFATIGGSINWDEVGLQKTEFFGSNKPFRPTSITFKNQKTNPSAPLKYRIPSKEDDESLNKAAIALEGLYLFSRHKNWDFKDGDTYLIQVQEHLDIWGDDVVNMLCSIPPRNETWDALDGAVELIVLGAALTGQAKSGFREDDLWRLMWGNAPTGAFLRTPELKKIAKDIGMLWTPMQKLLRAWYSGTKGGQVGAHLNPTKPRSILGRFLRNNWSLTMRSDGESSIGDFKKIGQLYDSTAHQLGEALAAELQQYSQWSTDMDAAFGDLSRADILKKIKEYQFELADSALSVKGVTVLENQLLEFSTVNYDDARKRVRALVKDRKSFVPSPTLFGIPKVSQSMDEANKLVQSLMTSLSLANAEYEVHKQELGGDITLQIERNWEEIEISFDVIGEALSRLAGEVTAKKEDDDATN